MIRLHDVDFQYPRGDFRLRIGELAIGEGARVAVIGPSGSGKTTLLNLVAGVAVARRGRVVVDGTDLCDHGDAARRAFRVRRIGMVFQAFELLAHLSVLDNILLPYRISGALALTRDVRRRAAALAAEVGIGDKARRDVRRLSQGEQQRVAICRALVTEPVLLLADEPTGNLDPRNKGLVLDILIQHASRRGATLLTVTHDHNLLDRFERVIDFESFDVDYGGTDAAGREGTHGTGGTRGAGEGP